MTQTLAQPNSPRTPGHLEPGNVKQITWPRVLRWMLAFEVLMLLAVAQVMYGGYKVGVGNQSIQIPFLKYETNRKLFAQDEMVKTIGDYPSLFFKLLAIGVGGVEKMSGPAEFRTFDPLISVYFWLHVLTTAGVLACAYALGRTMFKSRLTGGALVLMLLAGHHQGLAGDPLYSIAFTHTWAVFPLAIGAMALFYRGWYLACFALVGFIFNLHALTAGYLMAMMMPWVLADIRKIGWKQAGIWLGAFLVIAGPTLYAMMSQRQSFDQEWLYRTRVRSADHSFPFTWWNDGATDIPRFVLLVGLFAVSYSFATEKKTRRKTIWIMAGAAVLFVIGTLFTEIWPVATVVRAQLFRASRLLIVVMLAHVASGVVAGWGMLRARAWHPFSVLEALLATATFACVAIPGLMAGAPWVLAAGVVIALANGRLSWLAATVACASVLVVIVAWKSIEYHIPGIDSRLSLTAAARPLLHGSQGLWVALGGALAGWVVIRLSILRNWQKSVVVMGLWFTVIVIWLHAYRMLAYAGAGREDAWIAMQVWAANKTPVDSVFLTPPQPGGFRIHSSRSVVCEWRDGTQLYFSSRFSDPWWQRLSRVQSTVYDSRAGRELERGASLEEMGDDEILELAREMKANFVVLPSTSKRTLVECYTSEEWTVYEARIPGREPGAAEDGGRAETDDSRKSPEELFLDKVARPNIEKYRKSDVLLCMVDEQGNPLAEGQAQINQTRQAFGFGCSIPPFGKLEPYPEWVAPPANEKQLALLKDVFNYTVIPFSAKWQAIEPVKGARNYDDLDKVVDWCSRNGIEMEFHYLGGFTPRWALPLSSAELKEAWFSYCRDTVARYQDRIRIWQVTNDKRLFQWTGELMLELKSKYPHLRLGISDCAKFHSTFKDGPEADQYMMGKWGLAEIEQLQAENIPLDYFATHAHSPHGVWPDMRVVYHCLDRYARYGIKVHATEITQSLASKILGTNEGVRPIEPESLNNAAAKRIVVASICGSGQSGTGVEGMACLGSAIQGASGTLHGAGAAAGGRWTPELMASYLESYYTTLFSHPAVDAINYWDLSASVPRFMGGPGGPGGRGFGRGGMSSIPSPLFGEAGLLNPSRNDEPRLAYLRLKELIRQKWMTRLSLTLSGDSELAFRGFHGDYEVIVRTADGRSLRGTFNLAPGQQEVLQVKLAGTKTAE